MKFSAPAIIFSLAGFVLSSTTAQKPEPKEYLCTFKTKKSFESFDFEKSGLFKVNEVKRFNAAVIVFDTPVDAKNFGKDNDDIKACEENHIIELYRGTERKLAEDIPYGIDMVNAAAAGDYQAGSGIKVCVIDDGYDNDHPDLPVATGKGDLCCFLFFGCGCAWDNPSGNHGTHVSGTIAAIGGNNQGVVGVMRNGNVPMHGVRVFGTFPSTSTANIMNAMDECDSWGANVVNMSLGGSDSSNTFREAFQDIINSRDNILFVAAAGNAGNGSYSYPASFPELMSVASVDSSETVSSYSQFNDEVDIAAPGEAVYSTFRNGGYGTYSGTSMASPHVAGVAALIWSYYPNKTADEVRAALESSAKDLGANGYDVYYGHGLVDAVAAKAALGGGTPPSPTPPSPTPPAPCNDVIVTVKTDNYPLETSWEITDSSNSQVAFKDDFDSQGTTYTTNLCLASDDCYTFTIYDSWGDGICCGYGSGSYSVSIEGVTVVSGGSFGSSESTDFGDEHLSFDVPSYGVSKTCKWLQDQTSYSDSFVCTTPLCTASEDCLCTCAPYL